MKCIYRLQNLSRQNSLQKKGNSKIRDVTDNNKTFWSKVKHLFPEKVNLQKNGTLLEKVKTSSEAKFSSGLKKAISDKRRFLTYLRIFLLT